MRFFLILAGIASSAFVGFHVKARTVSLLSLVVWIASIAFITTATKTKERKHIHIPPLSSIDWLILGILSCVALPLLLLYSHIPSHFFQDEFISAYTSYMLPAISNLDWFAAYPGWWVSQFPVLFFILQKPFFLLFGPTLDAIRISVWPYYLGILVYLYLLALRFFSRRVAIFSSFAFVFLAANLYLWSTGVHFISSAFFYIAFLYHLLMLLWYERTIDLRATGVFLGLSYLTYTSSYVALPVFLFVVGVESIRTRSTTILTSALQSFCIAAIVLLPFLVYAGSVHNFFVERIDQVNIFTGSWANISQELARGVSPLVIANNQIVNSIKALFIPGIGGHGGYSFGGVSLFDPLTGALFIAGILLLVSLRRAQGQVVAVLLVAILVPIITGLILTIHPPPLHRISVVYPLFVLLVGLAIDKLSRQGAMVSPTFGRFVMGSVCVAFLVINLLRASAMVYGDERINPQNTVVLSRYLHEGVPPESPIYIGAFSSFHLGPVLFFHTKNTYTFITDNTANILFRYTGDGPVMLLNPKQEILDELTKNYPNYKTLRSLYGESLGDVTLFTPPQFVDPTMLQQAPIDIIPL